MTNSNDKIMNGLQTFCKPRTGFDMLIKIVCYGLTIVFFSACGLKEPDHCNEIDRKKMFNADRPCEYAAKFERRHGCISPFISFLCQEEIEKLKSQKKKK